MTSRLLPSATAQLRASPARPARHTAVPRNRCSNSASVSPRHSTRSGNGTGPDTVVADRASSGAGARRALMGHASWHRSQPNAHVPISGRSSSGIAPRCSMVRYAMHRRASITPGATIAPVGHAGMHARHVPQPRLLGLSGGRRSDNRISASITYEPASRVISDACLPVNPMPARSAMARSIAQPWSMNRFARTSG